MIHVTVNGTPTEVAEPSSVADLLQKIDLPGTYLAVEVNAQVVPREEQAAHRLRDGDAIEVVTLVGGG